MRSVSPQASTRRPTTFRAIVPMTRMMATAVRKPSPGTARPNILSNIGANTSSMRLQKIQRSQAVRKTGTVKKKPAMKRTLNQFFTRDDMIESRITPPRPRALITGGARRVGRAIALALAHAGLDVAIGYHRSAREASGLVRELEAAGARAGAPAPGDRRALRGARRRAPAAQRVARALAAADARPRGQPRGRRGRCPLFRDVPVLHHGPGARRGRWRGRVTRATGAGYARRPSFVRNRRARRSA